MAQSGTGDILKFGLLAVGGYLLYNWWTSQPAVAAAPAGTTSGGTTGGTAGGTTSGGSSLTAAQIAANAAAAALLAQQKANQTGPVTGTPVALCPAGQTYIPPNASNPAASGLTPSGVPGSCVMTVTLPGPSLEPLSNALQTAGGGGMLNVDQWNYYLNQMGGAGLLAGQISTVFPNVTDTDRGSMTAQQFVAALAAAGFTAPAGYGLNGLGQLRPRRIIHVPAMVRPAYRRFA